MVSDPVQRMDGVTDLLTRLRQDISEAEQLRNQTLSQLRHEEDWSLRQLSQRFGMSKTAIATVTG